MANPSAVEEQVRFALSQLPAQNAHHDFEHICRHLTQQFICSNVLPATGPVSAGGDQGRDFETFRTYLRDELGPHGGFLGLVNEGTVAFICTTQADNLPSKLKRDIERVCASGHAVYEIRAFTLASVPVGTRHRLQSEIQSSYGVRLEFHDAESIASLLARTDGFWIAERFLSIPAEIRPDLPDENGDLTAEYVARRLRWRTKDVPSPTLGDFIDLKEGLRQATFEPETRGDLPFWIGLTRHLLASPKLLDRIRQRARYELAVATLRGTHDLRPVDDVVRAYLDESLSESDPARLQDASALLGYANGAVQRGITNIDPSELERWNTDLRDRVEQRLPTATPHRRASLLFILGFLGLQLVVTDEDVPSSPLPQSELERIYREALSLPTLGSASPTDFPFVDELRALSAWTELVEGLDETPLFPLRTLGELLQMLMPLWRTQAEWRRLVDLVDEAIGTRSGTSTVAERARDRAMALLNGRHHLEALEELHRAKADWWLGDTVRGSLLAMLMISRIYLELRLPLAAKAHALAAAYVAWSRADDELSDLIPQGLIAAADADFIAGSWCGAIELLDLGLKAVLNFEKVDIEFAERDEVQDALLKFTYITSCARDLDPQLAESVRRVTSQFGLDEAVDEVLDSADPYDEPWSSFAPEHLTSTPFSDLGETRCIRFSALGTDWSVESRTDIESLRMSERFAAAAQVVLATLAQEDLCLLPTRIHVRIENRRRVRAPSKQIIQSLPSNDGRKWTVRLAPVTTFDDAQAKNSDGELVTMLMTVLRECSLLPDGDFSSIVERAFERGLGHMLSPARPYDELAATFTSDTEFKIERSSFTVPWDCRDGQRDPHRELQWQSGLGPTFSREQADQLLQERYELLERALRKTVTKLHESAGFQGTVKRLRSEGWRDWHILLAILNVKISELNRTKLRWPIADQNIEDIVRQARQPEDDDAKLVPVHRFTYRALQQARRTALLSLVNIWDLETHQSTPDFPAIERLLAARYGYWVDDVEHTDPFPGANTGN